MQFCFRYSQNCTAEKNTDFWVFANHPVLHSGGVSRGKVWCFYPHMSRDSESPVCGIFPILGTLGRCQDITDVPLVYDDIAGVFFGPPPQAKCDLLGPHWLQLSRPHFGTVGSHQDFTDVTLVTMLKYHLFCAIGNILQFIKICFVKKIFFLN